MKYRDNAVIIFKDKFTDDMGCKLCSNKELPNNMDRILGDAYSYVCTSYRCMISTSPNQIHSPFFDNTKHTIILSIDTCKICPGCIVNMKQCPHNIEKLVIDCMNSLDNYTKKEDIQEDN